MQKEKIIKTYQDPEIVKDFDKLRGEMYAKQKGKQEFEEGCLLRGLSILEEPIRVLDVGCGTGRMIPLLLETEKDIYYNGLDTSMEMLGRLHDKFSENILELNQGDATKMIFNDNSFDIVYCFHVLWHLPPKEQEKIIKEMKRVCKPEGVIIFDTLNKNFIYNYLFPSKNKEIYKVDKTFIKKILPKDKIYIDTFNDSPNILARLSNIIKIRSKSFYHLHVYSVVVKK